MIRVLYLSSDIQDYQSDCLLHGLKSYANIEVVDYPRKSHLYRDYKKSVKTPLYGKGFTLYGLLPDLPVDRTNVDSRLRSGEFDLVVFADIWRNVGHVVQYSDALASRPSQRVAVVDGSDSGSMFPYSRALLKRRQGWILPDGRSVGRYFKREWTEKTVCSTFFGLLPRPLGKRFYEHLSINKIAFAIPAEKIDIHATVKSRLFCRHIVDPQVARRIGDGADTTYRFDNEQEYYNELGSAKYAITMRRSGWECLRHYEIAARGAVICFKDLTNKPSMCAPHGLDSTNSITYRSADELLSIVNSQSDSEYERLQDAGRRWILNNTTQKRAWQFMKDNGIAI